MFESCLLRRKGGWFRMNGSFCAVVNHDHMGWTYLFQLAVVPSGSQCIVIGVYLLDSGQASGSCGLS